MAVKEAACAKLSIPWRPNLGIQRVSNAKGSLAYKCFWHPTATPSAIIPIRSRRQGTGLVWPATRHSWLLGSRTSWQLYLWRGHYGDQGMYGILTLRLGSVLGFQGSGQRVQGSRYSLLVVYPVTGHPVGEANYLAVEGQGPVGMSTTAIILAQFKVAKANDFMLRNS